MLPTIDCPLERVAVVLVNYRDYADRFLADCHASLLAQTYPASHWQLFVVDNASTEASRATIARLAPSARILPLAENGGWATGNNTAIQIALKEGFAYVVLLNLDTVVEPGWLQALVDAAHGPNAPAIVQSVLLLHGRDRVNSLGNRIQFLGFGYCGGYGEPTDSASPGPIDFASGAAMLVRRDVFEAIGLFRDLYFLYHEDLEFGWRARLAGFTIALAPGSICHHKYAYKGSPETVYYLERNRLLTMLTLPRLWTLLLTLPMLLAFEGGMLAYCGLRGWVRPKLRSWRYFFSRQAWSDIAAHRRHVAFVRRRRDREVVGSFASAILFPEVANPVLDRLVNPFMHVYWSVASRLLR